MNIPSEVQAVMDASWEEIQPRVDALLAVDLTEDNIEEWLADWTSLDYALHEARSRLYVAHTIDTTDENAETQFYRWVEEIDPNIQKARKALNQKLVDSGIVPEAIATPMRNVRAELEIFREENLPLNIQVQKQISQYNKIIGAQTIEWQGEEITLIQADAKLKDPDRTVREKVWRLMSERQLADEQALDNIWIALMDLRKQIAHNAGFSNFRDYIWKDYSRHDYTPDDCLRFHDAIEQTVVPAAKRIYERHREQLGLDTFRPWDVYVDPAGRQGLAPFQSTMEFEIGANHMLGHVDETFGDYFQIMRDENLLDLENRKGKAPGGYCTAFPMAGRPFIFMNAVGVQRNVRTLLHEAGHAFHVFESSNLRFAHQRMSPMEFNEVASMAMELLAAPYYSEEFGGYYDTQDAARARIEQLEMMIRFWPYMAVVDAFQHWVYENHDTATDPANCDAKWSELWDRFMQGIDYTGLEDDKADGWHRKLHIYRYPFYYIEYGLAQLGSAQVWRNSLQDQKRAIEQYRDALRLGGTVPLPKLYEAAGVKLAFDAETLGKSVDLIMRTLDDLERQLSN